MVKEGMEHQDRRRLPHTRQVSHMTHIHTAGGETENSKMFVKIFLYWMTDIEWVKCYTFVIRHLCSDIAYLITLPQVVLGFARTGERHTTNETMSANDIGAVFAGTAANMNVSSPIIQQDLLPGSSRARYRAETTGRGYHGGNSAQPATPRT